MKVFEVVPYDIPTLMYIIIERSTYGISSGILKSVRRIHWVSEKGPDSEGFEKTSVILPHGIFFLIFIND